MKHLLRRAASRGQVWGATAPLSAAKEWRAPTTPQRRPYHFSSPTSDPATVRLYRILLRSCRELEAAPDTLLLLHPPLNPHMAGLSRVFESSWPHAVTAHHVLRLFGHWREQELNRAGELTTPTTLGSTPLSAAASANDPADAEEEEDKLIAWLGPLIAQHGVDAWMDTETLWTTPHTIRQAIRLAFKQPSTDVSLTDHRGWAIRAFQYLSAQAEMHRLARVTHAAVRITTVARCVGRSASAPRNAAAVTFKYRFVYRIRMENTTQDQHLQLLGRSWVIQEGDESDNPLDKTNSIRVHAPHTGAVGKHPVLGPGQCFEYMSGCDLATPTGLMKGTFYFGAVPAGTRSASVGQAVPALEDTEQRLEVVVTPFPLQPDRLPVQFDP